MKNPWYFISRKKQVSSILLLGISGTLMLTNPTTANTNHQSFAKNDYLIAQRTNQEIIVNGNEPFWSITINTKGIVYSTPESRQSFPYVSPQAAAGRPADLVRVYRLRGRNNTTNTLVIRKGACSDTMSDINYPYSAVFITGNSVLEGCARLK